MFLDTVRASDSVLRGQKAVTAYFSSKQLLPFGFAGGGHKCCQPAADGSACQPEISGNNWHPDGLSVCQRGDIWPITGGTHPDRLLLSNPK